MSQITTSADPSALADAEARRRIADDLDHSLVVVAGAGTGKTSELVGRVLALVLGGHSLRELAVITFTEAAAAELRTRLADALARAGAAHQDDDVLRQALTEVDEAAVCTLHAFAKRMLVEHVLAAGLPPGFEVLDELSERVAFDERLSQFTDSLLGDRSAEKALLRGFVLGLGESSIAELAWCLHANWDRLEDAGIELLESQCSPAEAWPAVDVRPVLSALDAVLTMAGRCTDESDRLLAHLQSRLASAREVLGAAAHDELAALPLLLRLPQFTCGYGRAENWGGTVTEVRAACADAEDARLAFLGRLSAPVVAELVARLAHFTLEAAEARRSEGRLSFHDLLVHARRLLRHHPQTRAALRQRYQWLLVDEFQDTDPLQVELAAWLASAVEGTDDLERTRPGALFVVGDPKQSIYRFRRADIAMFETVCSAVGDEIVLSANFRSVPGLLRFVNALFPVLFGDEPGPGQARYDTLVPVRRPLPGEAGPSAVQLSLEGLGSGSGSGLGPGADDLTEGAGAIQPPVAVVGGPIEGSLGEVRHTSARDLAAVIDRAVAERWPVSRPDDPLAPPRPMHFRDVAVLIPSRASLPALEEAFDEAAVPYRLEGAALLWGSDEVRDVLAALAAADEPSDAVSVLAALRSPGLGCGDDDLVSWHSARGSWDPRAPVPEGVGDHPVARAMRILAGLHRRRWWSDPSDMIGAATEALDSYALAFAHRRPRQHWQRLRWLADQGRLFDETVGGSLHDFLRWAELQCSGDGRAAILGPPEADDDAVRVMTIHGSKGLEFPMVAMAGLERDESAGYRPDPVLWIDDDTVEASFSAVLRSAGYTEAAKEDRDFDRLERARLMYVAMTRARDHLVLCLHHKTRNGSPDNSQAAQLEGLCREHPLLWRRIPGAEADAPGRRGPLAGAVAGGGGSSRGAASTEDAAEVAHWVESLREWADTRDETLRRARALTVVTASALAHDPTSGAVLHEPEWATSPGGEWRGGSDVGLAVGRAVHGVMAVIDVASGRDALGNPVAELARQRAATHGVPDHAADVAAMVDAALASPTLRHAACRPHHREAFLSIGLSPEIGADRGLGGESGAGIFEGFADLLVEDEDGLVIVDYKTDRIPDPDTLALLQARYSIQVAAYAEAAEAATATPVTRAVLLFLGGRASDGSAVAVECVLEGTALAEARATARAAMVGRMAPT